MKKQRIGLLITALTLFHSTTYAVEDFGFSVDLGAGTWKYDFDGTIATDPTDVDVQIDLGLGDDTDLQYFIDLSFTARWLPSLRFEQSTVVATGIKDLGRDIIFDGVSYRAPSGLRSTLTYKDNHLTAYYTVLRTDDFKVDLGLGVKQAESSFTLRSTLNQADTEFDETIPMLHLGFNFKMLSGWSFSARAHALTFGDNQVIDGNTSLHWESPWKLGLQIGYRHVQFKLEDTDDYAATDLRIFGPFASLTYHF